MFIRKYCKYKDNAKEELCVFYKLKTCSLQNILQMMWHERLLIFSLKDSKNIL